MKSFVTLLITFVLISCSEAPNSTKSVRSIIEDLETYGRTVAASTDGAILFVSAIQTMESPMNAFQLRFSTNLDVLMSASAAAPGNAEYLANIGKTKVWSAKFCTAELKGLVSRNRIDIITGNLTDPNGKTQSMAIC